MDAKMEGIKMKSFKDNSWKSKFTWLNRRVILWIIIGLLVIVLIDISLRNPASASQATSTVSGMVGGC